MVQQQNPLDALRKEIDAIDDSLHELLVKRASLARDIAKAKGTPTSRVPAMRPAREADILRRLAKKGGLSARLAGAIWREIISASLQSQTPFHLHVSSGAAPLARDHFGLGTQMRTHETALAAVQACANEPDSFAVVPAPTGNDPWWNSLAAPGEAGPRVMAKLPFAGASDKGATAYAVGAVTHEASGDDTTCLRLEFSTDRAALEALLKSAGFSFSILAQTRDAAFAEVQGFVGAEDPRLKQVRAVPVGGFANPIVGGSAP